MAKRIPAPKNLEVWAPVLQADNHRQTQKGLQQIEWFLVLLHVANQAKLGEMGVYENTAS